MMLLCVFEGLTQAATLSERPQILRQSVPMDDDARLKLDQAVTKD